MRVHLHRHATVHQYIYTLKSDKCSLKHRHPPKRLRGIFKCMLHVFHDCLITDSFFDTTLRLHIEGVSIESCNLALPTKFSLLCAVTLLA